MKLILDILFFIILSYFVFTFVQLLVKMRKNIIIPLTAEERIAIRKQPDKPLALPTYSGQKVGIIVYSLVLIFILTLFVLSLLTNVLNWPVYLLLFLPLANASNFLNLFAVVDDGIVNTNRFVPWKSIKSFHFVRIDGNHKYYGYSKETNSGYELKIKTRIFPVSCVVTTDEMKRELTGILREHVSNDEMDSALNENS